MTMFTEGRLQAYERMMQQLPSYRSRVESHKDGSAGKAAGRHADSRKAAKGGDHDGSDPGKKK